MDNLGQVGSSELVDNAVQAADRLKVILYDVLVGNHRLRGKEHEYDQNLLPRPLNPGNDLVVVVVEVAVQALVVVVELVELELVKWEQQYGVLKAVVMAGLERRIRTTTIRC